MNKPIILCCDPPWSFKTHSKKGAKKSADAAYDTMSEADILALAPVIKKIAGRDAAIFMWCTAPHLAQGMATLANWGFEYKSYRMWRKTNVGTGYWSRNDGEIVLIGTRGRFKTGRAGDWRTIFDGKRDKRHSAKPETLQDQIEKRWPDSPLIELFARRKRKGWLCIGGDLDLWIKPDRVEARSFDAWKYANSFGIIPGSVLGASLLASTEMVQALGPHPDFIVS